MIRPSRLFVKGFIVQIIIIILLGLFLYKGCEYVNEHGLKHIVNDVWEGTGDK